MAQRLLGTKAVEPEATVISVCAQAHADKNMAKIAEERRGSASKTKDCSLMMNEGSQVQTDILKSKGAELMIRFDVTTHSCLGAKIVSTMRLEKLEAAYIP